MESRRIHLGSGTWTVRFDGPDTRHIVVTLPDSIEAIDEFADVSRRLHNSGLRTILVELAAGPVGGDVGGLVELFDHLKLPMVNLVGQGAGALPAWRIASVGWERFLGLIVIGGGHPAVPDPDDRIRDPECRRIEVPTTVIVGSDPGQRRWAEASRQYVVGDYRIVGVAASTDSVAEFSREIAGEIVLRTSLW